MMGFGATFIPVAESPLTDVFSVHGGPCAVSDMFGPLRARILSPHVSGDVFRS